GYMGPDSPAAGLFAERYPADFIAEGLDQTRGWFYSLMAEGVLLFGESAYRNVICHGFVVDPEGRKMSKRLGNVMEPDEAFDRDALERYDATGAARRLEALVDDLSNWYVRRSRRRFWDPARSTGPNDAAGDKVSAYATLLETLTTIARLLAPFTPFIAEEL